MKKVIGLVFTMAFTVPSPVVAQVITSYVAEIGYQDMQNSRGVQLDGMGTILQQDRANFHRFGIRQQGDSPDPLFGNRQHRARIPVLYQNGQRHRLIEDIVKSGHLVTVQVVVYGQNSFPTRIEIDFADGSENCGC